MRLDQPGEDRLPRPSQGILDAQQALHAMLSPQHPAEDATRTFTDLRVISALLCRSWPLGQDLMHSRLAAAVSDHVRQLNTGYHLTLDGQPSSSLATAGLLTAAIAVRDSADLQGTLARHVQPSTGIPAQAWTQILARHQSACSPALREAAAPLADGTKLSQQHLDLATSKLPPRERTSDKNPAYVTATLPRAHGTPRSSSELSKDSKKDSDGRRRPIRGGVWRPVRRVAVLARWTCFCWPVRADLVSPCRRMAAVAATGEAGSYRGRSAPSLPYWCETG